MVAFASIIVPCRNEERFIAACLDSLIAQTYGKENFEIIVVDGASIDNTARTVKDHQTRFPRLIKILQNEKQYKPFALNIGIQNARGSNIMIADAHATYSPRYLEECIQLMGEYGADVVGGIRKAKQHVPTLQARAIARVFSHPLGVGNATYQIGAAKPQWVDAVFGGCYRKELFNELGLFNENLIRSQDMEMSVRLRRAGKKILLAPDIECTYYPKTTIKDFFLHNIQDGIWAIYPLKFVRIPLRIRHYIPLIFLLGLIGLGIAGLFAQLAGTLFLSALTLYAMIVVLIAAEIAREEHDFRLIPFLIAVFFARHFGYGIGSLLGILKLLMPVQK